MSNLFNTTAVYVGRNTGIISKGKREGQEWQQALFKVPEVYKGNFIKPDMMAKPNMTCFLSDDFEFPSDIQPGSVCDVQVTIGARLSGDKAYPEYSLFKVQKRG
jgi:hypothetical protein